MLSLPQKFEVNKLSGLKINFPATKILAKTAAYWNLTIREALEIQLDNKLFNRDTGLQLSSAWKPATSLLAARRNSRYPIGSCEASVRPPPTTYQSPI